MAGAGAGAGQGPAGPGSPGAAPEARSDWAGLPEDLLVNVAGKLIAQTEAGWAAQLKRQGNPEYYIQRKMAKRKREGPSLFVFALVCKGWRKAQLKVGGPLRSRMPLDVIQPGQVELVKWALAEGCPREAGLGMARYAAQYGHLELVQWLCGEGGFPMNVFVMRDAAESGNLELVQWLRAKGCPWNFMVCHNAVKNSHVEVLRWARKNGCKWQPEDRDKAAAELGYTDDFKYNVVYYSNRL